MLCARTTVLLFALAPLACFQASNDEGTADEATAGETTLGETSGNDDPSTTTSADSLDTTSADEAPETSADTTSEPYCGNGVIEAGETCDAQDVGGMTCASFGHASGEITCNVDCTLDVDGCYTCGDAQIDGIEACDADNLAGNTCASLGYQDAGALYCAADCLSFDVAGCVPFDSCGNGLIDGGEQCDGAELGGQDCTSLGYSGGTLGCSAGCLFETSGCAACGNGVQEPGEECDEFDFGGASCQDYGYEQGFLSCNAQCTIETYDCCPNICP